MSDDVDPGTTTPTTGADAPSGGDPFADPAYLAAVIDLIAVLAYGELTAFERLAEDAKLAPSLDDKAALAEMASAEFDHYRKLRVRLNELGTDPSAAMEPFVGPIDGFHEHTAPSDWLEGLVKAYVGDGIAADFYREIAARLDPQSRRIITEVLEDTGHAAFVVEKVRAAIAEDHRVGGRLALWGRRLMGEALSQAQRVAADREALSALLAGGVPQLGVDLVEVGRMFTRLAEKHSRRMTSLGLSA